MIGTISYYRTIGGVTRPSPNRLAASVDRRRRRPLLRIEPASWSARVCSRFRTSREAPERPQLPPDRSSAARPHVRGATALDGGQRVALKRRTPTDSPDRLTTYDARPRLGSKATPDTLARCCS